LNLKRFNLNLSDPLYIDDYMSYSEPKELIRARKLIEEAKFEEALQIVDKFGEKKRTLPT